MRRKGIGEKRGEKTNKVGKRKKEKRREEKRNVWAEKWIVDKYIDETSRNKNDYDKK